MAVNFGLLQQAQPASAFFQGQQDVQAEQERNMLRQQQMENMAAQRAERQAMMQDRQAMTQERTAKAAQAAKRQEFLAGLGTKMAEGGHKLDRPTLGQMLQFGMQTGEDSLIKLASEGLRALDEETREAAEMSRIRGPAPSAMPSAAALPAAPAAPVNMLAGTPFDIGTTQPAPANALAARPAAAESMVGGFTRSEIAEMAGSNVKAVRERGERLLKLLPKDQLPRLADKFVPVGKLVFDRETGQFITPPAAAIAATQDRGAAAPALAKEPAAKPPTAAQVAKTEAQNQARVALSKDLQTVLGYYEKLTDIGGMVSPERTAAENIIASARTSGPGQVAERTVGTKAQTLRDNISNSRQRLLSHIKNATGASAQQMNSNVELQTWLNALTNPSQSIETVRETLGQLDTVIAGVANQVDVEKRGGGSPRPSPAPASDLAAERENARSAIAAGAPEAAVRKRFKEKTGQEL